MIGTLPLTWEKELNPILLRCSERNTPTCVGKGVSIYAAFQGFRCHLYEKFLQNNCHSFLLPCFLYHTTKYIVSNFCTRNFAVLQVIYFLLPDHIPYQSTFDTHLLLPHHLLLGKPKYPAVALTLVYLLPRKSMSHLFLTGTLKYP